MDRLTGREENTGTAYYLRCFDEPCLGMGCDNPKCRHNYDAVDRLAAYEDTGLTPEEVEESIRSLKDITAYYETSIKLNAKTTELLNRANAEIERYKQWVIDLQSGMYVNCVYCGHRYGPESEVPRSMADALKEHIEHCAEHPMSQLRTDNEALQQEWQDAHDELKRLRADLARVTAERDAAVSEMRRIVDEVR